MDAEHGLPVVGAHLEDQVVPDDAGVVDQHGDRPELAAGSLDGGRRGVLVGDVRADRDGLPAGLPNGVGGSGGPALVEVDGRHRHPVGAPAAGRSPRRCRGRLQ